MDNDINSKTTSDLRRLLEANSRDVEFVREHWSEIVRWHENIRLASTPAPVDAQ
jgi:hypothetical protein